MAHLNHNLPNPFQSLPNPFQNSGVQPVAAATITTTTQITISAPKITQNDTNHFHGYRSNFNINQQKEIYQQRMTERIERDGRANQRNKSDWNLQNQNGRPYGNSVSESSGHNSNNNWCELCECGFKFPKQLEKHQDEHEKCWFDDCKFEGHSKLLKKHVEMHHQSEIFQRVPKVESEEDIMKWREQRRKCYPTKKNIEARRLAQEERMKRGERIQEPRNRFGNMNNRKSAQHRSFEQNRSNSEGNRNEMKNDGKNKRNDNKRRRTRNHNKNRKGDGNQSKSKDEKNDDKIEMNTNAVNDAKCTKVSPNEPVDDVQNEKIEPKTNALSAIMCMYGSESESDDVEKGELNESQSKQNDTTESNNLNDEIHMSETTSAFEECLSVSTNERSASIEDELPSKQTKIESEVQNMDDARNDRDNQIDETNEPMEITKFTEDDPQCESDDDAPEEQPIQRQSKDLELNDAEGLGRTKVQPISQKKDTHSLTNERIVKKKTVLDMTRKIRNQNTLLEKLLQKDIRHERNVLLQCVRYVVKNNFFGIGQKTEVQHSQIEKSSDSTKESEESKVVSTLSEE